MCAALERIFGLSAEGGTPHVSHSCRFQHVEPLYGVPGTKRDVQAQWRTAAERADIACEELIVEKGFGQSSRVSATAFERDYYACVHACANIPRHRGNVLQHMTFPEELQQDLIIYCASTCIKCMQ